MNSVPTLYIGVAAPLVEMAYVWMARMAEYPDMRARMDKLKDFPRRQINAYALQFLQDDRTVWSFRSSIAVPQERVRTAVTAWLGVAPEVLPTPVVEPIAWLDHQRALVELQLALQEQPVRVVTRIGLTLQQWQRDLAEYRPALVLLNCHGTGEGCLWFEDGRGRGEIVSGERLFAVLPPRPQVLFLSACHSTAVLRRAREAAQWDTGAIVSINADTPVQVTACVVFESMFFTTLVHGRSVAKAFAAAQQYVANDSDFGDFTVAGEDVPASQKFCLYAPQADVGLAMAAAQMDVPKPAPSPVPYPSVHRNLQKCLHRVLAH